MLCKLNKSEEKLRLLLVMFKQFFKRDKNPNWQLQTRKSKYSEVNQIGIIKRQHIF